MKGREDNQQPRSSAEGDEAPDYDVGYGKPPRSGQFKKGQSGHPRGRPKGSKSFARIIREGVAKRIEAKVDGKIKTITMAEAVLTRLLREAAAGNQQACAQVVRLMERYIPDEPEMPPKSEWQTEDCSRLTDAELNELGRLAAKARGNEQEWLHKCALDDKTSLSAQRKLWGPTFTPQPKDPDEDIICVYIRRCDYNKIV